jgi:hypothetical protein
MTETKKATIKELRPDDKNINQSSARGGEMLRRSLQEYGAARSLVADKNMRIVAGNQTLEAAAAIGLDDVVVVPTDGSKLVVVQRTDIDLDTPRGRELAIADNRTNQVGYNPDPLMLAWHGSNGADLDKFWLPDELAALDLPDVDGLDLSEEDDESTGDAEVEWQSFEDKVQLVLKFERSMYDKVVQRLWSAGEESLEECLIKVIGE